MFLKQIKLTNFRNYQALSYAFETAITVLHGNNAQGKSNFLESIYYLATTKSPKAEKEEELIGDGQTVLRVEGIAEYQDNKIGLEIVVQDLEGIMQKRAKVNGISKRIIDYSSHLAVALFSPEDINLVAGSPSLRRSHIDHVLSQIDRSYKKYISSYEEVITKKNKILKRIREGFSKKDELTFWSDQQILLGEAILIKRREFFKFLNQSEKRFGDFEFNYLENPITAERLNEYELREIEAAASLIGPHRDDFTFTLGEKNTASEEMIKKRDLSKFGSRGEQRTAVLDLKLTEVDFMEKNLKTRPILLLDDIFSELDIEHRQHVMEIARLQQTVITAIDIDGNLKVNFPEANFIKVEDGSFITSSENGRKSGKAGK